MSHKASSDCLRYIMREPRRRRYRDQAQRPSALWRRLLYTAVAAVAASGLVCLSAKYLFARTAGFDRVLPDWSLTASTIHGGLAMLASVVFGATLGAHAYLYRRAVDNRLFGYLLIIAFGTLLLTGYGLYYLGSEALREYCSLLHSASGLALVPLLVAHVAAARRRQSSKLRLAGSR
jgi:hypothetical protein